MAGEDQIDTGSRTPLLDGTAQSAALDASSEKAEASVTMADKLAVGLRSVTHATATLFSSPGLTFVQKKVLRNQDQHTSRAL
jgi:hypothetical protein